MIESSNYSKGSTIVRIKAQIEKIIIHGIVTYREYFLVHDRYRFAYNTNDELQSTSNGAMSYEFPAGNGYCPKYSSH